MSSLRTTLTLDDDVAAQLRDEARRTSRTFKELVNESLRRGLSTGARPGPRPRRFRVRPKPCGFHPGIDPMKLNQLLDELEIERAAMIAVRDK